MDQKLASTSEIQAPNSSHFIIGQRMSIASCHCDRAMPHQMLDRHKIDSGSHEARRKRMSKIVKTQMRYEMILIVLGHISFEAQR